MCFYYNCMQDVRSVVCGQNRSTIAHLMCNGDNIVCNGDNIAHNRIKDFPVAAYFNHKVYTLADMTVMVSNVASSHDSCHSKIHGSS